MAAFPESVITEILDDLRGPNMVAAARKWSSFIMSRDKSEIATCCDMLRARVGNHIDDNLKWRVRVFLEQIGAG